MNGSRPSRAIDDDYDFEAPPRRRGASGLIVRGVDSALRNPVMAAGTLISGLSIIVIVANALANQPVRHPSPLFNTRSDTTGVPVATVPIIVGDNPQKTLAPLPPAPPPAAPRSQVAEADPAPVIADAPPVSSPPPVPQLANLSTQLTQQIQAALRDRGFYTGAVDGIAGPATSEAIRAFEQRLGVAAIGSVDDHVLALLKSDRGRRLSLQRPAASVPQPVRPAVAPQPVDQRAGLQLMPAPVPPEPLTGSIEGRVQKVQRALNVAGYGMLRTDGRFDDKTAAAIRKFEAEHGMPITGRLTDRLMSQLVVRSAEAQ